MTSKIPRDFGVFDHDPQGPRSPLVCEYRVRGNICGREPVKYFKNLRRNLYVGFCKEHSNCIPEGWAAFKPVSKEEAVTHEVMDS